MYKIKKLSILLLAFALFASCAPVTSLIPTPTRVPTSMPTLDSPTATPGTPVQSGLTVTLADDGQTITLKVEDTASPLTAAFPKPDFPISDEVFQLQKPYSRQRLHVLLSIDTNKTDMNPPRYFLPERLADKDFAISWVRRHGKGRVFCSSLGHNSHVFWNPPVSCCMYSYARIVFSLPCQ